MRLIKIDGAEIKGIAACAPAKEIINSDFGKELYGDDLGGAIKVVGVEKRRVCEEGKTTSLDLCVRAALTLREAAAFDFGDFGGLVFVTQTPDLLLPNNSTYAHSLLGLPLLSPAFDITLACSGYPYGLWVSAMMAVSCQKPILLLDGDTHSHFVSPKDRATALLFGDAGTATVIAPNPAARPWHFDFVTDGAMRDALTIRDGGYRNRVNDRSAVCEEQPDGATRRAIDMKMDGMSVFNGVVRYAPDSLKRVMEPAGANSGDYDFLLLHQANLMMIKQVAKKLGFKDERFPTSLQKYGNVSSASIPLTICSEIKDIAETKKSRVLMSAFGAGFSVGSASLDIGPCACTGVAEYEE
jgi:3-oxoacyl-[acyl-carrier-protein] synthase-3